MLCGVCCGEQLTKVLAQRWDKTIADRYNIFELLNMGWAVVTRTITAAPSPGPLAAILMNMRQFFICNHDEVDSTLQKLTRIGTSDDGWTDFYLDEESNEEWHLTRYNSEYQGGGISVLKKLPIPTIEQLIDISMTSTDKNNIIGASLELSERERYNKEDFRDKLIERLLKVDTSKLTVFESERLKIIIYESDIYDATNRRNIVGKHFIEIQNDAGYYRAISDQAKTILRNIEKYSR